MTPKKILITGASGLIGRLSWKQLGGSPGKYDLYGFDRTSDLTIHSQWMLRGASIPSDRLTLADISDFQKVSEAVKGMDTVIHLAANPSPFAPWKETQASNIGGSFNVFEASRLAGVRRIIYASSVRVSEGYYTYDEPYRSIHDGNFNNVPEKFRMITPSDPVRPVEAYGASKVFSESLARISTDVYGISCIGLRIGLVSEDDVPSSKHPGIWCSHRDVARIIQLCVDAPETLRNEIFYCISNSSHRWIDTSNLRTLLGFEPQDSEDSRQVMLG